MHRALWIAQYVLALVFLFAGTVKLLVPVDVLQMPLPEAFVQFIACVEILGAIGLILPALLRIRPLLTPLAAAGLVVVMTGAVLLTPALTDGQYAEAVLPLVLGILAALVAYGRWRIAPIAAAAPSRRLAAG